MRLEKEDTVLVVIDIQERLFPVMSEKEVLLKNTGVLIEGSQLLALPVLLTQQYTRGLGETLPELKEKINGFLPIEKTAFSCYDEPVFVEKLEETACKNVLICGIESHVCVLQTAVDLKAAGYNPVVVFDCVSSRSEANKSLALERFRHEGIMVAGYESALFELTKNAKDTAFKGISTLVK
jgi:nicotinamidase-related amidase